MNYSHLVVDRVSGIPCIIAVKRARIAPGSYNYFADSDIDYYGFAEFEYDILDSRGKPAKWLEKKLTDKECERIETLLTEKIA